MICFISHISMKIIKIFQAVMMITPNTLSNKDNDWHWRYTTDPLNLVPLSSTFSEPPNSMHRTAFLMYSWPWIEGASDFARTSNTSTFLFVAKSRMVWTSLRENVGATSLLMRRMLFARRMVLLWREITLMILKDHQSWSNIIAGLNIASSFHNLLS